MAVKIHESSNMRREGRPSVLFVARIEFSQILTKSSEYVISSILQSGQSILHSLKRYRGIMQGLTVGSCFAHRDQSLRAVGLLFGLQCLQAEQSHCLSRQLNPLNMEVQMNCEVTLLPLFLVLKNDCNSKVSRIGIKSVY